MGVENVAKVDVRFALELLLDKHPFDVLRLIVYMRVLLCP
jgi:hypothetical protein